MLLLLHCCLRARAVMCVDVLCYGFRLLCVWLCCESCVCLWLCLCALRCLWSVSVLVWPLASADWRACERNGS
jgi:hypothetical protein